MDFTIFHLILVTSTGAMVNAVLDFATIKMSTSHGDTVSGFLCLSVRVMDTLSCAAMCSKDSQCHTFVFSPSTYHCKLFNQKVKNIKIQSSTGKEIRIGDMHRMKTDDQRNIFGLTTAHVSDNSKLKLGQTTTDIFHMSPNAGQITTDILQKTYNAGQITTDILQKTSNAGQITTDILQKTSTVSPTTTDLLQKTSNAGQITTDILQKTSTVSPTTTDILQKTSTVSQTTTDILQKTSTVGPTTTDISTDKMSTLGQTTNSYSDYKTYSFGSTTIQVKKHQERLNWAEALKVCQREGGSLLKIETRDRKEIFKKHIQDMAEAVAGESLWIGLFRKDKYSLWEWTDGSECGKWPQVLVGFFTPHSPRYNCAFGVHSVARVKYYDDPCSNEHRFVCERV